jgi:hypothetical protein
MNFTSCCEDMLCPAKQPLDVADAEGNAEPHGRTYEETNDSADLEE